jgi:hypothetical protein
MNLSQINQPSVVTGAKEEMMKKKEGFDKSMMGLATSVTGQAGSLFKNEKTTKPSPAPNQGSPKASLPTGSSNASATASAAFSQG